MRPRPFSFLSASRVALILMLAASAVGVQASTPSQARTLTIAQVDGGPHYYGQFSHPLPDNPHYFPIMAWLRKTEQQSDIDAYVDFGLNRLVGGGRASGGAQETLLRQAGLHMMIQADERTRFDDLGSGTEGWLLGRREDMHPGADGVPERGQRGRRPVCRSDGRLRFNDYGKGVLEWGTDDEAAKCWLQQAGRQRRRPVLVHGSLARAPSASATCTATTCRGCGTMRALGGGSPEPIWMDVELG